jgi:hypothetical protein
MEYQKALDDFLDIQHPQINIGYYIAMRGDQLLNNEVLEEILRERANRAIANNEPSDAWIEHKDHVNFALIGSFLDIEKVSTTRYYSQNKIEIEELDDPKTYFSYLYSSSLKFITWIRLRLGYFEDINEPIDGRPRGEYISDGFCGTTMGFDAMSSYENNKLILDHYILGSELGANLGRIAIVGQK